MLPDEIHQSIDILKSYYLFQKDSKDDEIARAITARAGIESSHDIFRILAKLGIFDEDENIELLRYAMYPLILRKRLRPMRPKWSAQIPWARWMAPAKT